MRKARQSRWPQRLETRLIEFEEADMPSLDHVTLFFDGRKETIFEVPFLSTTSAMQYSTSSRKHVRQHVKALKFPKVLYHHRAAEQTDMRRLAIAYNHGL
jgi:hypothetical protein